MALLISSGGRCIDRPNRAVVNPSGARLRLSAGNAAPIDFAIMKDTYLECSLPVRRGVYRIEFFVAPVEQSAATQEAGRVVSIANLRLVNKVTGQAVR